MRAFEWKLIAYALEHAGTALFVSADFQQGGAPHPILSHRATINPPPSHPNMLQRLTRINARGISECEILCQSKNHPSSLGIIVNLHASKIMISSLLSMK